MQKLLDSLENIAISSKKSHDEIIAACDESEEVLVALHQRDGSKLIELKGLVDTIEFIGIHPAEDDEEQEEQEETPGETKSA